jgi:putative membrane protein
MNSNSTRNGFLICSLMIALAGPPLFSQTRSSPSSNSPTLPEAGKMSADPNAPHSFVDQAFVKIVLERDMAEIQLGQLAQQKAQSDDVKALGQQIVDSRTKLDDGFKAIAKGINVSQPKDLSKKDKQTIAKLQGLSGPQFDEEYIKVLLNDQRRDRNDFQVESGQAEDPNVKQATQQDSLEIDQRLKDTEKVAQAHNIAVGQKN